MGGAGLFSGPLQFQSHNVNLPLRAPAPRVSLLPLLMPRSRLSFISLRIAWARLRCVRSLAIAILCPRHGISLPVPTGEPIAVHMDQAKRSGCRSAPRPSVIGNPRVPT